MIDTFTILAGRLSVGERRILCDHLTRSGSDFQKSLEAGTQGGTICLAYARGEIIGWARADSWENWPTLEAFVRSTWRGRGVATYCAAGLVASGLFRASNCYCAVFDPSMMKVAGRVGLHPIRFSRVGNGWSVDWRWK